MGAADKAAPVKEIGMAFQIQRLDHLVLTVASINATVTFYETVLGMSAKRFGPDGSRIALHFGNHKINLHEVGREFEPKAERPTSGSADLCFIVDDFDAFCEHLTASGIDIVAGPGPRSGAMGPIRSIYFRDPDMNLIEVSTYDA